jgi:hypothetical protein
VRAPGFRLLGGAPSAPLSRLLGARSRGSAGWLSFVADALSASGPSAALSSPSASELSVGGVVDEMSASPDAGRLAGAGPPPTEPAPAAALSAATSSSSCLMRAFYPSSHSATVTTYGG